MNPNEYALTFEFNAKTSAYEQFTKFVNIIGGFEELNKAVSNALIDTQIEIKSIIIDIEKGSIKTFFADILEKTDDKALKDRPFKEFLGSIIVTMKYNILKAVKEDNQKAILQVADDAMQQIVSHLKQDRLLDEAYYYNIDEKAFLKATHTITSNADDKNFYLETKEHKIKIPHKTFSFEENQNEKQNYLKEQILTIKKPDLLGDSKWSFKYLDRTIEAKITDTKWLDELKQGFILLGANYKLIADMLKIDFFDADKDYIRTEYQIIKIHDIIKPTTQTTMEVNQ